MKTYGVIMAGGGGTRFWPLSRHEVPKQLLNLSGKEKMINETIDRVATLAAKDDIFVVTNVDQVPGMKAATTGRLKEDHILSELVKKYGDGIMCIFPSDHFIKDESAFTRILKEAISVAKKGSLVTLGITPTFPSTGYGYIKFDKTETTLDKRVVEFKEKPDEDTAKRYVSSGEYSWNSGMFVWQASVILDEFRKLLPDVYECLEKIGDALNTPQEVDVIKEVYPTIPSISIDYGIMEKSDKVRVISAEMGWNDVGSWDNLGVLYDEDSNGNITAGDFLGIDTKNCITYSSKRLISTIGVEDLIIVETDDAIMVIDKNRAQDVKKIVDTLKEQGRSELL